MPTTEPAAGSHPSRPAGIRWDPGQYHRFTDHRLRPALELLDRIPIADAFARLRPRLRLGQCHAGHRGAVRRRPGSRCRHSSDMLAKAAERPGRIEWVEADIAEWEPERAPEVIYSNAALHWVDDHTALFPRLFGFVAPGGCLAVQMPQARPSHVLIRETLASGGVDGSRLGDEALAAAVRAQVGAGRGRVRRPARAGGEVPGRVGDGISPAARGQGAGARMVKATGLRPILNGLHGAERDRFLEVYRERLRPAYPRRAGGHTLYPFRRLFMVATPGD